MPPPAALRTTAIRPAALPARVRGIGAALRNPAPEALRPPYGRGVARARMVSVSARMIELFT